MVKIDKFKNFKKYLYISLKVFLILAITAILTIGGLYLYAYLSPKIAIKTNGKFYIYDKDNALVYQGSSTSEWVNIEDISRHLKDAIISVEDKNFYKHQGFDYLRIARAMARNIKTNSLAEGASTISQQYVKNMYLTFDKKWSRKIEEALLTLELEVHYSKDEILEGYLNTINFGQGNYGIQDAALYYFNKSAKDLNLEESLILAGIPKSPGYYNPVSNYEKSIYRAKIVAETMVNNGYITEEDYKNLFKEKIEIHGKRDKNNLDTLMYYQDAVLQELNSLSNIPNSLIDAGGLKIYTTLDLEKQANLESAMKDNMKEDKTHIAAVYIDPTTGEINALIGGRNYSTSQYNRVTQSKRQVGSTMKPFLYYSALSNGLTMASTFRSEITTFNLSDDKTYSPSNFNNLYANKDITMAAALAYSDNIYAVKTHIFLGSDTLVDTMKTFGLKEELQSIPSLALGTKEINMLDYATAYTTLASGGYKRDIHLIRRVEDMNGNLLYEYKGTDELVLNYNNVFIINQMLKNAYNSDYIDYNSPTAINLKGRLTKEYAIKTGTTDNDHWVVGYNPDALLMVWTGDDQNAPVTGYAKITKNIWADAMENCLKDEEDSWYETPRNVIGIPLNPITGTYATKGKSSMFYFVKGTEPQVYVSKDES